MSTLDPYTDYRPAVTVKRGLAGLGLFAEEEIAAGQLIIEYIGDRITEAEANRRGGRYLFAVTDNLTIDGKDRGNAARYINHACDPNAEAEHETTEDRVYIRAIRTISPGEEITYDYGTQYFEDYLQPGGCKCRSCAAATT